jgi:hypothetical protein
VVVLENPVRRRPELGQLGDGALTGSVQLAQVRLAGTNSFEARPLSLPLTLAVGIPSRGTHPRQVHLKLGEGHPTGSGHRVGIALNELNGGSSSKPSCLIDITGWTMVRRWIDAAERAKRTRMIRQT